MTQQESHKLLKRMTMSLPIIVRDLAILLIEEAANTGLRVQKHTFCSYLSKMVMLLLW